MFIFVNLSTEKDNFLTFPLFHLSPLQLLPFIIVGANYEHVILFLQTYKEVCASDVEFSDKIGHVMKRCSLDIVLPVFCNYTILLIIYFVFNTTAVSDFVLQVS